MTKTISTLALASVLSAQLFGAAPARAEVGARQRGQVVVDGATVKAVVVGPIDLHAYSEFSGGALYTALAVTGTDADCQGQTAGRTTTVLGADVVVSFDVPAGHVACLTTTRQLEVLWHGRTGSPGSGVPGTMMARR